MPRETALDVEHLTVRYGDTVAVDGLDLQLRAGETVALLGPNGAGKSTIVGSGAFVALGLLVGFALDEKAAGGAVGILGVVLAALGGLWVPVQVFPEALRALAHTLPSYWYAELGRDVVAGGTPAPGTVLAVAGFAAAFGVLATAVARRRPLHAVAG